MQLGTYAGKRKYAVFMGNDIKKLFYTHLDRFLDNKPAILDEYEQEALLTLKNQQVTGLLIYGSRLKAKDKEAVLNTIDALNEVVPSEIGFIHKIARRNDNSDH